MRTTKSRKLRCLLTGILALAFLLLTACRKPDALPSETGRNYPQTTPASDFSAAEPTVLFEETPKTAGMSLYVPANSELQKLTIRGEACWVFEHLRDKNTNASYYILEKTQAEKLAGKNAVLNIRANVSEKAEFTVTYKTASGEEQTAKAVLRASDAYDIAQVALPGIVFDGGVDGYDLKLEAAGAELCRIASVTVSSVEKYADPEENLAQILDGLFAGKTKETITDTGIGAGFGMHFGDFVRMPDGEIYNYYICYATKTGKGGVGLATSKDGLTWENKGCVIEPDEDYDANGAYFSGVWRDTDGKFYLVYECKGRENSTYGTLENIALAVSDDGMQWEKQGVILYKNTRIPWQKANVGTPDLYKEGDVWYLTFHGFDFQDCQIGIAYGKDLTNLVVVKQPVIPTSEDKTRPDSGTTGRRDVIHVGDYYYMVYEVSTDQVSGNFGGAHWTHMFARSRDMLTWESVEAPLLTQETTGFGYDGPAWLLLDGEIYVYFRQGNSTTRAILTLK